MLAFSADQKAEIETDVEHALSGMNKTHRVQEHMGNLFPERGIARPEQYDEVKRVVGRCRDDLLDQFATTDAERAACRGSWPVDE